MRFRAISSGLLAAVLLLPAIAGAQPADAALTEQAASAVRRYAYFSIFDDVNISVTDRAITLTGVVTMPFKRDDLTKQLSKLDGVRSVVNELRVLPVSNYDVELRMRIAQAIYGHPAFWQYAQMASPPIHIVVENGQVTLTGRVNGETERALACAIAHVPGAFKVTDNLKTDRE